MLDNLLPPGRIATTVKKGSTRIALPLLSSSCCSARPEHISLSQLFFLIFHPAASKANVVLIGHLIMFFTIS
jgi:hypothetical protein